ncbi:MAG: DUF3107 domain-containing protein [Actinomycetaceae bacterium]|nr:DUF3107 domain-containing protein [Actinomycetaceae bacterium]
MELHIGVRGTQREMAIDVDISEDDLKQRVSQAASGNLFELKDTKGRVLMIPGKALGYVEIVAHEPRRVGFGL